MKNYFSRRKTRKKTIMVSHSVYFADNYFGCQHRCNVSANELRESSHNEHLYSN